MDEAPDAKPRTVREVWSPSVPFDSAAYAERVPPDATTRGMFFHSIRDALLRRGCEVPPARHIAFKTYPMSAYHQYIVDCAARYCPAQPAAQGVYELGHSVYPAFASSLIGKAIFAVAGIDMQRLIELAPRAYSVANSHGKCVVVETSSRSAHWRLDGVWDFLPFSVGIAEGAARACKLSTFKLEYVVHDIHDVEFWATW